MISSILRLFAHVGKVTVANGKKRLAYSFLHILLVAIAVGLVLFIYWGIQNFAAYMTQNLLYGIGIIVGIAVAIFLAIYFVIQGVVSQIIVLITGFIGIFVPKNHLTNFLAFLVALVSLAAAAYAIYALLPYLEQTWTSLA